ncbi:MAG TPA: hypothetical protein VMZ90_12445, partial [Vicinamibacterales bacterium]|nr:hypothetical protein [Vicinamibacterales bacterium]
MSRIVLVVLAGFVAACGAKPVPPATSPAGFAPTIPGSGRPVSSAPAGMAWIPGGEFSMGSEASSEALCELPGITR